MAKSTSRLKLPYPEPGDPADGPNAFLALASRLDSIIATEEYDTRSPGNFVNAYSGWTIVSGHLVRVASMVTMTITVNNESHTWQGDTYGVLSPDAHICRVNLVAARPENTAQGFWAGSGNTFGIFGHVLIGSDGVIEAKTIGYGQRCTPGEQIRITLNYPSV